MTRLSLFNSPFLLGFDQFERTLDRVSKASNDGYPPYNIEQTGENGLRITLAVAGFARGDLNIEIEDNQLSIGGARSEDDNKVYLHHGIATRQFRRTFVVAEGIEVESAELDSGLLHINLTRPLPEIKIRRVEIRQAAHGAAAAAQLIDVDTTS